MKPRLKSIAELLLLTALVLGIQLGMIATGSEKKVTPVHTSTGHLAIQKGARK